MSDNTQTAAPTAPAVNIPLTPLVKLDENGKPLGEPIIPTILVVGRGEAEGNPYPAIVVTEQNFKNYVNLRGIDSVLDTLNAKERLDAQAALDHVLTDSDWEEQEDAKDKQGKPVKRFTYILGNFVSKIKEYYETLLSGKVRGGVTITDLEDEQEALMKEMQKRLGEVVKMPVDKIKEYMLETNKLSIKHQEISVQIEEIRKARKPRMTKAEKLAREVAAQAAKAAAGGASAPAAAA